MGSCLSCGSKKRSADGSTYADIKPSTATVVKTSEPSTEVEATVVTSSSSPTDILDNDLKNEIKRIIDEEIASVPDKYNAERDHIINEMQNAVPGRYLGLVYADYPDINGRTVNEMAKKVVTSVEVKQGIVNQVEERTESSFQSRTVDQDESFVEEARTVVKEYIEQNVNEAFNGILLG